jgi:hypothetical protein
MARKGALSNYFEGVVVKKLSAVEADKARSNQHEYNGVKELKELLGDDQPVEFPTRYIWLADEQDAISVESTSTWYDARERHPTRTEYRLYFPTTPISEAAKEGDALFIAKRTDGSLVVLITPSASTIQSQLVWLFGLPEQPGFNFSLQEVQGDKDAQLDFAERYILDELGIEPEEPDVDEIDKIIAPFGLEFPSTAKLSELARESLGIDCRDNPDAVLLQWLEREEAIFKRLERVIVSERIKAGFMSDDAADVDGFIQFSLGVQNRRKSRAGRALEHHLECIFRAYELKYAHGAETENKNKPDFLFPGAAEYHDAKFPVSRLTVLGAKSTLKDRWRQVLLEANRITAKHLLTLEPRISENQTEQMKANNLSLVVPAGLHATYKPDQQAWLLKLSDFLKLLAERQKG